VTQTFNPALPKKGKRLSEKRAHDALDVLCRERDAELFTIHRQSLTHREKAAALETANHDLAKEVGMLRDQVTHREKEMLRVMFSFFIIGAVSASVGWYSAVMIF